MSRVLDMWAGMTGTVLDFAGTTAPNGWLLCFGQSLLRADYPHLFAKIGTTYGSADATHFNLPDCRGRVAAGKDNMGGAAANRLTTAGGGVDGSTLGAAGGADTHTLTSAQIPAHSHGLPMGVAASGAGAGANIFQGPGPSSGTNTDNNTGGGNAHPITQPTMVFNKIIKT